MMKGRGKLVSPPRKASTGIAVPYQHAPRMRPRFSHVHGFLGGAYLLLASPRLQLIFAGSICVRIMSSLHVRNLLLLSILLLLPSYILGAPIGAWQNGTTAHYGGPTVRPHLSMTLGLRL